MTDVEKLRRAVDEGEHREDTGAILVAEIKRLTNERDAILRWSIRHAGYLGTREDDGDGRWWAMGDDGRVKAPTAEQAVRKAAGLGPEEGRRMTDEQYVQSVYPDADCWLHGEPRSADGTRNCRYRIWQGYPPHVDSACLGESTISGDLAWGDAVMRIKDREAVVR